MNDTVIKVENLSKRYRLGTIGGKTLREDVQRWWARMRGKPDPLLKVDEVPINPSPNNKSQLTNNSQVQSDILWALRNVSFDVKRGEILGIIGQNGAGKSTLLKIISQITAPTSGEIKIQGRIGSLLEVGTGFHPELTGRENTYLNGAILGMSKQEVDKKFGEIVTFSEIQKFIDTPVKRYSSGMFVRLAFAVAAHLDPEILVVDEVLAVGDARFQKKCLGKMKDVSGEGRTVLFVSHNMVALQSICNRAIWINNGQHKMDGESGAVVSEYLKTSCKSITERKEIELNEEAVNNCIRMHSAYLTSKKNEKEDSFFVSSSIYMVFDFSNLKQNAYLDININVYTEQNILVFQSGVYLSQDEKRNCLSIAKGRYKCRCKIPPNILNAGFYNVKLFFGENNKYVVYKFENVFGFEVKDNSNLRGSSSHGRIPGVVRPLLQWETIPV